MCFAWISEQTAIILLYSINLSVCITEAEGVYYAVGTGSLNQTYSFVLKGLTFVKTLYGAERRNLSLVIFNAYHFNVKIMRAGVV